MNVIIQKKPAFVVAGIMEQNITSEKCQSVWQKLFTNYEYSDLEKLGEGKSIGVCSCAKIPDTINYMAGYVIHDIQTAKTMGLELLEVEETEYAVVEVQGPVPECIHAGWKFVMETYFPESGYTHSEKPDFEVYLDGDVESDEYKMELWIPVIKAV